MARRTGDILKPLIAIDASSGCWMWLGKINRRTGYGHKQFAGRTVLAHRWVFQWFNGWIPREKVLDHTCRNRACVNPGHLQVVSQATNARRGIGTRLSESDANAIKLALESAKWGDRKKIADRYGVSTALISDIKYGRAWRLPT